MNFKLEAPEEVIQQHRLGSINQAIDDFAHSHPAQWFVAHEGVKVRRLGGRFTRASYEIKYRTKMVDGTKIHSTYLRYVGPNDNP